MIPVNRHRIWQLVADGCLIALAWYLAFELRFDQGVPRYYDTLFRKTVLIVVAIQLVVFVLFRFYDRWWRYVSIRDMWSAVRGVTVACVVASLTVYFFSPVAQVRLPRSVAVMDWLLLLGLICGSRLLARSVIERPGTGLVARGKEVLIAGAGDAGQLVIREMQRNRQLGYTPIGLIDDDPRKKNLRIHGIRVLGTTEELAHILRDNRPDEVLIAIPSASGEARQRIVTVTRENNVPVKTLPALYELISGESDLATQIRPVQVDDVLGREPVEVDLETSAAYLKGKTVLVTGAGGSIGSELCRQIARVGPQRLILVDQGETALFEIERELVDERGFSACVPVLADCQSRTKMHQVFDRYRPTVVFHAAAYKHVPLMEANPLEAIRNNAIATRVVAETAAVSGAERFVLVSTDKAVNPHTVMGASKAMAEWIVQAAGQRHPRTRFLIVRFGNVLASSGSVVPIFRAQIERGGPLTVTHPEMSRYFMTIPEAVQLVIQAGDLGAGSGEMFVLEMGHPVKILDLARNMIRLAGYEPDEDIAIEFTGPRLGEKIHEELFNADERSQPTTADRIVRAVRVRPLDPEWVESHIAELERMVASGDETHLAERVVELIAGDGGASVGTVTRLDT